MKTNLIVVSKNKLIGVDAVLPVLMEIKNLYRQVQVIFVFINDEQQEMIKQNYNLWEAIETLRAKVYVLRTKNKLLTLGRFIKFFGQVLFSRNIFIKDVDALPKHDFVMKLLRKVSKVREIKTFLTFNAPLCHEKLLIERTVLNQRRGRESTFDFFSGDYNYFLASLSAKQFKHCYHVDPPEEKMVEVGYLRGLPQWQSFLSEAVRRNSVVNSEAYFLYVLCCEGKRLREFDEPELIELIRESLLTFKKYNHKIKTVFKPHALTNVPKIQRLLDEIGYTNYTIDYGHPMVLSWRAKFIFGNVFSSTMVDAYYLGKPVVEYCSYDPEIYDKLGRESYGGKICDFFIPRNPQQLEEVVGRLIEGQAAIERDRHFIQENFPATSDEFYSFWHNLLSS